MPHPSIFIFWGEQFAEAAATIFVSELRGAGLCTKVVGLRAQPVAGQRGLRLLPDLTLGQTVALAPAATCVILPCDWCWLQPWRSDPRLGEFFRGAARNHAGFLIGGLSAAERCLAQEQWPALALAQVYPPLENLVPFARTLPERLGTKFDAENCKNLPLYQ